jgi:hypothetical protein
MILSTHVTIALAWLNYTNTADVPNMSNILADNFLDTIRPVTLNIPVLGKRAFLDRMRVAGINYGVSFLTLAKLVQLELMYNIVP